MGEETVVKNGRISHFQGLVTLTLTLDRVILHTGYVLVPKMLDMISRPT